MDVGLDTGDIILKKETTIGVNETSAELFDRLSFISADALLEALNLIESGLKSVSSMASITSSGLLYSPIKASVR